MLDTHGRKYVQPLLDRVANFCIKSDISANQVTIAAFVIGIFASFLVIVGWNFWAVLVLWLSGLLDAVDGTISRKNNTSSPLGTLMDIVFDRIVEIAILLALIFVQPELALNVAIVFSTIIVSMTIFLTVGAVANPVDMAQVATKKSFYYQAGVAERTEGFICLSLAVIMSEWRGVILHIFAGLILFTAIQRFLEAVRILKS